MKNLVVPLLLALVIVQTSHSQDSPRAVEGLTSGTDNAFTRVEVPSIYSDRQTLNTTATSTFVIEYSPAFPDSAKAAIQTATNIWSFLVRSTVPIRLRASWVSLSGNKLAETRLDTMKANFPNAPQPNTYYTLPLAEAKAAIQLNRVDSVDFAISFNKTISWSVDTTGLPKAGKYDLVTTAMHEIGHGLGFALSFNVDTVFGRGSWGTRYTPTDSLFPTIFDSTCVVGGPSPNHSSNRLIWMSNSSTELGNALKSNNIFFDGGDVSYQVNANKMPKLYAPSTWKVGSSISHLDSATFPIGSSNSLMKYIQNPAEIIQSPGEVGLSILQDLGWTVNRVVTVTAPSPGITLKYDTTVVVRWTDNIGGLVTIDLLRRDLLGNFIPFEGNGIRTKIGNRGVDTASWTVSTSLVAGDYRLRMWYPQTGDGYGLSSAFKIGQVAAPTFDPPAGEYQDTQYVRLSSATGGATIRYTMGTNPPDPDTTSMQYTGNRIVVGSRLTMKAKAWKAGLQASDVSRSDYVINPLALIAPQVFPLSGTYPAPLRITYSWPAGTQCLYIAKFDGTEPPDPCAYGTQVTINPETIARYSGMTVKIKLVTSLNGHCSSVTSVTYSTIPGIRIAQVDSSGAAFGTWSRWEGGTHWSPYGDTTFVRPGSTEPWSVMASQNYKPTTTQKYNAWIKNGTQNIVVNHSDSVLVDPTTGELRAQFIPAKPATVRSQLIDGGLVGGTINFKDPWVIDSSDSKGNLNRGMNAIWHNNIPSPFKPDTSALYKGVFLNQSGPPLWNPPYYSVSAAPTQPINGITSYFANWGGNSDSISFQNAGACMTAVVFRLPGAVATAFYKGHNLGTAGAYASNNQRKVGLSSSGIYCMVYSSGNPIWFTRYSTGPNTQELEISAGSSGSLNTYPSIVVNNNMANVVWQSIEWSGAPGFNYGYIHLRRYNIVNDTWGPIETIGSFVPTSQDFPASPVIAATSLGATESQDTKAVAWKDYAGITLRHCVYGWGQAGTVSGTDAYSNYPSIEMAPQNAVVILCWENSMSESIRYVEGSYNYATNVWSFTNASAVSPADWASNQRPCLALGYSGTTYRVTVAWQGYGNVVEGGSTVNVRQAPYPASTWDPGITSFSFMGTDVMYPAVGTFNGSNQLGVLWSFGGGIYRATYNGSNWTGPSLLASGSVGGSETNINTSTPSMLQAVWRKPASGLTGTRWGAGLGKVSTIETASLSPFGLSDSAAHPVSYKLNRHQIVDLAQALDPEPEVSGMVAFEIAGANPQSAGSRTLNSGLFAANPRTSHGTFVGAIYGTNIAIPQKVLIARRDALARVVLIDRATGGNLREIWKVPFSSLSDVKTGSFGTFREIDVDLTGITGKEVAIAVEMVGGQKEIQPLIVDNYLVLSRPPAGDVAKPGTLPADNVPGSYALHQNYPNPFNPSTSVSFDLPEAQTATLKLYSILGEELMTLAQGQFAAGRHSLLVDCSHLASGVYLYRIVAGSFSETKRMLLIK